MVDASKRRPRVGWASLGDAPEQDIGRLPSTAAGRPRFYINTVNPQEAGATFSLDLSLWTWTGRGARLLLSRGYEQMADQPILLRHSGGLLKLQVKEQFKTFPACGACEGRQRKWTIRLTPTGAEDLGRASLVPELDTVDELLDRAFKGRSVAGIATAQVARAVMAEAAAVRRINVAHGWGSGAWLGMLENYRVTGPASRRTLCLQTDSGGTMHFILEGRRVIGFRNIVDAGCGWPERS